MTDHEIDWPQPRPDPPEEPHHLAARVADRERGVDRGDIETEDDEGDDGGASA